MARKIKRATRRWMAPSVSPTLAGRYKVRALSPALGISAIAEFSLTVLAPIRKGIPPASPVENRWLISTADALAFLAVVVAEVDSTMG